MNYLAPSEYEQFGLETATPEPLIAAASRLMEAHCRRATLGVAPYTERMRVTPGRNGVRLSHLPLAGSTPIVAARGGFAAPRRGDSELAQDVARAFSLPGTWTSIAPELFDADALTGEVTFPVYALGLPYNEVEITYNAGLDPIPDEVKFACAQLVKNAQATPSLRVKSGRVDTMKLEYFTDSLLDETVRRLLAPYVAQKVA
jgi:hypothetical protein